MADEFRRRLLLFAAFLAALGAVLICVAYSHRPIETYRIVAEAESSAMGYAADEVLNINEATQEQLEALPGIGETIAGRIIAYREKYGDFHDVGELREIEGIGSRLLDELLPYIRT